MKKVYAVLFFKIISLNLTAQNYVPFVNDSAAWSVDFITSGPFGQEFHVPRLYSMFGDTVINSITYHKTFQYGNFVPYLPGGQLTAFIREQNKIIYCRYFSLNNFLDEFTLYDFNLNAGDTFAFPSIIDSTKMVVTSIDSEYTVNGYRKAFNFNIVYNPTATFYFNPRWVEGIGDIVNGIIYPEVPIFDWWCQSLCYYEQYNSIWIWNQGNCWITGIENHNEPVPVISLINNPQNDFIEATNASNISDIPFYICEITGQVLSSGFLKRGKNILTVNKLSGGIYVFKADRDEKYSAIKFIKN